jgi:ubiquinone biosynthesis protein UbiJ
MKPLLLTTLNTLINRYLSLDIDSKLRLQKLSGKAITIELLPFHFVFQAVFNDDGIQIFDNERALTETKITGTPFSMLSVMVNKEDRHHAFLGDLKIEGDAAFAQEVITLFDSLEIDWEEQCSHFMGDVPAYHLKRAFSGLKKSINNLDSALTRNINEYLHEEALHFPSREALNDFFKEIDILRMDVDRMDAKIKNLEKMAMEENTL